MTQAFVVSAKRTAVCPIGGAFKGLDHFELAAPVIQDCLAAVGLRPDQVEELILSNALGAGGNPARLAALAAGLPERVAGLTIDRQCAGGLDAIWLAAQMVRSGAAHVVVAGGTESYSRRPIRMHQGFDGADPVAYDRPPFTPWPDRDPEMHAAAADLAQRMGISRAEMDDWAVASHAKALVADMSGEITVLPPAPVTRDTFTRNLNPALCRRAKPISGDISSANAAVSADAAAFVVVVSAEVLHDHHLSGQRIVSGASVGADPALPGLAPVAAIEAALRHGGLTPAGISLSEVMEAYAAQGIACVRGAGLDPMTTNLGGGALARGHPVGASGAILAVRLFHELNRTGHLGLAAIAAAGGIGSALVLAAP